MDSTKSNDGRSRPTRLFHLVRHEDVSGISGCGVVAEGVQFHDGQCVLSWFGQYHTTESSPDVETLMALHGHGGRTTLHWEGTDMNQAETMTATQDQQELESRVAQLESDRDDTTDRMRELENRIVELELSQRGAGYEVEYDPS